MTAPSLKRRILILDCDIKSCLNQLKTCRSWKRKSLLRKFLVLYKHRKSLLALVEERNVQQPTTPK